MTMDNKAEILINFNKIWINWKLKPEFNPWEANLAIIEDVFKSDTITQ
jgi:hypothetical protein